MCIGFRLATDGTRNKAMGQLIWVLLLSTASYLGSGSACSDGVLQTCTNCGPGPNCSALYSSEPDISQSSHCATRCVSTPSCSGSWFTFLPGQTGRCEYYNCTQVQQQLGNTYYRKSCTNDTSCSSYEIIRYEDQTGACATSESGGSGSCPGSGYCHGSGSGNTSLPTFNTTSEYECLEACLDIPSCRSVSFDGTNCKVLDCDTSIAALGHVLWKRTCHSACASETVQRCVNCGQDTECQSSYNVVPGPVSSLSCEDECSNDADCGASYYNKVTNICELSECDQVDMDVNTVSFRKACYQNCSEYEVFKMDNTTANCAPYIFETSGMTATTCLDRCLDSPTCMSISFDMATNTCHHYTCTDRTGAPGSVFYWRNCLEPCDRIYTQTCVNCEASSSCSPISNETLYSTMDCNAACTSTHACNMAVFTPVESTCYMYECTAIQTATSFESITFRRACNDDCLNYKIEMQTSGSATCPSIGEDVGGVDLTFCMTRCLDMIGCRALTFNEATRSCIYHDCSSVSAINEADGAPRTIIRRICVDEEPERNYTQECVNCDISDAHCPRYITTPQDYVSSWCDASCNTSIGCTTAVFSYGECLLYDCKYVTQSYGVTSYRRTYNPECLRFKIDTQSGQVGTCLILNVTVEYPDYAYCLAACLDYAGCMAMTYMPSNHTCLFHACNTSMNTPSSADVVFVQRQCDPEACDRIYEQECINCDIHDDVNWSFNYISDMAVSSNCSSMCNETQPCGASVYNPTYSSCKMYNQTGLRMVWGRRAFRKSCRSDCPKFKLTEKRNKTGTCSTLETHYGIPTLDDCVNLCLDLDGCQGTTFYEMNLTCTLHDCGNRTNSGEDPTMFVFLTCNLEECAKTNRQVCMNCKSGPNCQIPMNVPNNPYQPEKFSLTHKCEERCNTSSCLASYFQMPEGLCHTLNCGQVSEYKRYHRVYRKTCTTDCPIFEIYTSESMGTDCDDLGDSGEDKIPDVHYCIETCLDIENCRAVNYNTTTKKCTFHSQCAGNVTNTTDHFHVRRECVPDDPPVGSLTQTCHNCGIGPDCPSYMSDSLANRYLDYQCFGICAGSANCKALHYHAGYSACYTYQCTQVKQKIGHTVYRRTNNTDCQEFELFTYVNTVGDCHVMDLATYATGAEYCMDLCLDMDQCRGISYYAAEYVCYFHNCTDYTASSGYTFIKRVCSQDFDVCERSEKQTCTDCSKGPSCQTRFEKTDMLLPRNINTSSIGVDNDYKQIWYHPAANRSKAVYCSEVDMAVGNIVHRATCTSDCPKFEIFIHTETLGACSSAALSTLTGGLSLHYCINKCLDKSGCRALNFNNINASCDLYGDCNNYTSNHNYTFFRRKCIDEATECVANTLQTCLNCQVSDVCQDEFSTTNNSYYLGECFDLKRTEPDSDAVWYDKVNNQCNAYQCGLVDFNISNTVYRKSCDQDCASYELYRKYGVEGVCDVIGRDAGSVTIQYCVERCIDMTGCRGVTFYGNTSTCFYHNCSDTSSAAAGMNTTFIERKCVIGECIRNYSQVCLNCQVSSYCQQNFTNLPRYSTWQECFNNTGYRDHAGMITYAERNGACHTYNCSLLYQGDESIVLRKSCASDCPIYRIAWLKSYASTCPVIGQDEGGVTQDSCLSKCLDMPGCRAISFTTGTNWHCYYHSCTDRVANSSVARLMWRECINETQQNVLEPSKPFVQRCLNCGNKCWRPISNQIGVTRDTDCNVTCPGCDMVWYDPVNEKCIQYGCDRIYYATRLSVAFFATNNSDCQEYEVFFYVNLQSTCDAIHYEEGLMDRLYCLRHCLDVPGCRSVAYDILNRNCTFHGCTNYTAAASATWFMERVCLDDTTHLLKSSLSCATPTFQTCLNCDLDATLCQSPFALTSGILESLCLSNCGSDPSCEAVVYSDNNCTMSQCDVVTPGNSTNGTLFRKICFTEDCPIFEVYQLANHSGVCDVMRTEQRQSHPEICFERCLRMPGCRAVTYQASERKCLYHSCDCSYANVEPDPAFETVFMWRYCLLGLNESTLLTNVTVPPKLFPDCHSTTTTTTTTTTATTTTAAATTVSTTLSTAPSTPLFISTANTAAQTTTAPNFTNIYIRSCLCSEGLFGNLTVDEISSQLIKNLTIAKGDTGASRRRLISIVDNRRSAVALGSAGILVLTLEFVSFLLIDSSRIIQGLQLMYRFLKRPK